jgi:hypothetical protein
VLLITEPLLSLLPGGIAVDRVEVSAGLVTVHAQSADLIACCPLCAMPSGRVHGRYIRRVADLPLMGRIVSLSLQIRRFRCLQSGCPRRIFAERLSAGPWQSVGGEGGLRRDRRIGKRFDSGSLWDEHAYSDPAPDRR